MNSPPRGYDPGENTFQAPPADRASVQVAVDPKSERLQLLTPFKPWDGKTPQGLPILIKVKGKCSKCQDQLDDKDGLANFLNSYGSHLCWWPLAQVPWTPPEHLP